MKQFVSFLVCVFSLCAFAQQTKGIEPSQRGGENVVFLVADVMPEFHGGQQALFRYLSENIKYPVIARENGIQGRVIVQFVVEEDGSIVNVEVVKSGGDVSLDKEAVRIIKSMPKWKPGKQRGKNVRTKYTLPINFSLTNDNNTSQQPNTSINMQVGDTIYSNTITTESYAGYCGDTIVVNKAPKICLLSIGVGVKAFSIDYYVLTDKFANDTYAFTHYIKDNMIECGHCKLFSSGAMQYLDTMYCYKDGKLVKAILYTPMDKANNKTNDVILKVLLYDEQEQLMREYRYASNQITQNNPIFSWTEFYQDGFYSVSAKQMDGIKTVFYSSQGKKISAKLPNLKIAKKTIQKQLQDSVFALRTRDEMGIRVEIQFFVDEIGNVLLARCGNMKGQFPSHYVHYRSQKVLKQIQSEANEILKNMSFELVPPGTINKAPQRMFCTRTLFLHNNAKMAASNYE